MSRRDSTPMPSGRLIEWPSFGQRTAAMSADSSSKRMRAMSHTSTPRARMRCAPGGAPPWRFGPWTKRRGAVLPAGRLPAQARGLVQASGNPGRAIAIAYLRNVDDDGTLRQVQPGAGVRRGVVRRHRPGQSVLRRRTAASSASTLCPPLSAKQELRSIDSSASPAATANVDRLAVTSAMDTSAA